MRMQMINDSTRQRVSGLTSFVCLILPCAIVQLFDPATVFAQSSVLSAPGRQTQQAAWRTTSTAVPNSISQRQLATEAMLARPVSNFGIRFDEELIASDVFETLDAVVFVHENLDGVFDNETRLDMKAGVSMRTALSKALEYQDASLVVEPGGSILIISIDDEYEPDFLSPVTYDITGITGSADQAMRLRHVLQQTIDSDSWEENGGGCGTLQIYQHNGRILMTIRQSYDVHLAIRSHFDSLARLAGGSVVVATTRSQNAALQTSSVASSVVKVPESQTTSSMRSRRGFARPGSNSTGAFGGGGLGGGVF